jgi:hypothetical protein
VGFEEVRHIRLRYSFFLSMCVTASSLSRSSHRRHIQGVFDAANAYEEALSKADNHTLNPIPRDQQEAADVAYFWAGATAYKIEGPPSQRSVLAAAVRLVGEFGGRLKAANIRKLEADLRSQQALAASAIELQAFLNSATTVLTIG